MRQDYEETEKFRRILNVSVERVLEFQFELRQPCWFCV